MKLTSVILAAGHGTRMSSVTEKLKVPKHLLPLGNGENPVSRLTRQLRTVSERVICLVQSGQEQIFGEHVPGIEILSSSGDGTPFMGSINTMYERAHIESEMVLFTTGDLVFDDQALQDSIATIRNPHHTYLFTQAGKHWHRIHVRLFCTARKRIDTIMAHPPRSEKVRDILCPLIRAYGYDFLSARIKRRNISLIANLNRPSDLELAQKKLIKK